jgi:hypothetical protein
MFVRQEGSYEIRPPSAVLLRHAPRAVAFPMSRQAVRTRATRHNTKTEPGQIRIRRIASPFLVFIEHNTPAQLAEDVA